MSMTDVALINDSLKKKLSLTSFYGKSKGGNIKAIINRTDDDYEQLGNLPYGTDYPISYELPYEPALISKLGTEIHIVGYSDHTDDLAYNHYVWKDNKWTKKRNLPTKVGWGAMCEVDGILHVCSAYDRSHYVYNAEDDTWTLIDNLYPVTEDVYSSYFTLQGVMHVTRFYYGVPGPAARISHANATVYMYNSSSNTWTSLGSVSNLSNQQYSSSTNYADLFAYEYEIGTNGVEIYFTSGFAKVENNTAQTVATTVTRSAVYSNGSWIVKSNSPALGSATNLSHSSRWINFVYANTANSNGILIAYSDQGIGILSASDVVTYSHIRYIPDKIVYGKSKIIVTDDNLLNLIIGTKHYIIDINDLEDETVYWDQDYAFSLPYDYSNGDCVVFNNAIYMLGNKSRILRQRESYTAVHQDDACDMVSIYDGNNWEIQNEKLFALFADGAATVFNNEIHVLGGSKNLTAHSKSHEGGWVYESTLPYSFQNGCAITFNGKLHLLGGTGALKNHYTWDGTEWETDVQLPYNFQNGCAVIYNNELHILGGTDNPTAHYKFDGTEWTYVSTLPYNFISGSAVVRDNILHIMGGTGNNTAHYTYDGSSADWKAGPAIPYNFYNGSAVLFNDEIYILGTEATYWDNSFCYILDNTTNEWKPARTGGELRLLNHSGVVFEREIHLLGGNNTKDSTKHYAYDISTEEWAEQSTLPFGLICGSAEVLGDEIHILGGTKNPRSHYSWDGENWTNVSELPYKFMNASTLVFNNELHILGSSDVDHKQAHYKWNGTYWVSVSTLPYPFYNGVAFIAKDQIHILGGHGGARKHYVLREDGWFRLEDLKEDVAGGSGVIFGNELHIFNSTVHSKLIDNIVQMNSESKLPYGFRHGTVVNVGDFIHMLGGGSNKHYKFHDPGIKPVRLEDVELYFY